MVIVVSFKASAARLSHEDAYAGTADSHARTSTAHFIVDIFIGASRSGQYTTAVTLFFNVVRYGPLCEPNIEFSGFLSQQLPWRRYCSRRKRRMSGPSPNCSLETS